MEAHHHSKRNAGEARAAWTWAVPVILLIALFTYSAAVKLADFAMFRTQMRLQPFPPGIGSVLAVLLPAAELLTAVLLVFKRTQHFGLVLSFIMMFLFTGYAALALLPFWLRTQCPCGGVLGHLAWPWHLAFNIFFLAITMIASYGSLKERRQGGS